MLTRATWTTGEGVPTILQGPGWGPASDYLRLTLAPLLSGLKVLTYDVRNTGDAPRHPGPDSQATDVLVADLEAVRAANRFERPVLIGHSHGAFVAMGYAIRHRRRVAALVLLTPSLGEGDGAAEVEAILRRLESDPRRSDAVRLVREQSRDPGQLRTDAELARWLRRTMPVNFVDLEAMKAFGRTLVGARAPSATALAGMPRARESWVRDGLPMLTAPTLVVIADHDIATPPSEGRAVASRIPGAQLAVIEGAGHNPWCERPDAVRTSILEFLERCRILARSPAS